jgi:Uma2 family endonuclease
MTTHISEKAIAQQRFILPGYYRWEQFEALEALMADAPGLRITYLDGYIEFMTIGENHETISRIIAFLLQLYFYEMGIRFIPVGSATRRDKTKEVSFQPDESYYIGEKKEHPDLAVEVVITSGGTDKLEKYKRLKIAEVWFWEDNQIYICRLTDNNYEKLDRSTFVPELDLALLVRCVSMSDVLEATTEFLNSIRRSR